MNKFYLAGPFFNDEQLTVVREIEDRADELGLDCFSPRIQCLCPPNAPPEQRKASFEGNCKGIEGSEFILARIDDFDPGTIWELGFAFGITAVSRSVGMGVRQPKLYAFTTVPSRGLNLMLAQSVDGFLQGLPSVKKFLEQIVQNDDREAQKWKGSII